MPSTYICARELNSKSLESEDIILFDDLQYQVLKATAGYYLFCTSKPNDIIFTILNIKDEKSFCGVGTLFGVFPYHENLMQLTETVKKLLIEYQKKKLIDFDWDTFVKKWRNNQSYFLNTIKLMCLNQVEQGNIFNPEIFKENKYANAASGGFDWNKTPEGYEYWRDIIYKLHSPESKKDAHCNEKTTPKECKKKLPEIVLLKNNKTKTFSTL